MSEETTIAKLISDEKISTDSTTLDALKCYVRSLPNDERMKERSVIHDFVENIGENKVKINKYILSQLWAAFTKDIKLL